MSTLRLLIAVTALEIGNEDTLIAIVCTGILLTIVERKTWYVSILMRRKYEYELTHTAVEVIRPCINKGLNDYAG